MKIAIRADGGSNIGMGHIMRTLVLADQLSKKHEVFYICRIDNPLSDRYKIGIDKVNSKGYEVIPIREGFELLDLNKIEADMLITDNYDVDENYFDKTKGLFKKTAYIDDMNLHYFNVDFLINQNIDGIDFKYKVNNNTKLLAGPNYVMLRDEFRNVKEKTINEKVTEIMITVGGADPNYVTEQLLSYVNAMEFNFHVVVGPSFEKNNKIMSFKSDNVNIYHNANMYKLMKECDIAISACGSTLYELAACGVPTLGVIIADNQKGISEKMDQLGIIKSLGWFNKLTKDFVMNSIYKICDDINIRKQMSAKAKSIIDGKGVEKIVQKINMYL